MSPVELVGFAGGACGIFLGIPQALNIRKLGHSDGVSKISWILIFVMNCGWASYGIRISSPSSLISNTLFGLVTASVVISLFNDQRKSLPLLLGIAGLVAILILGLPSILVSILLTASVFSQLPQIGQSLSNLRTKGVSAVSLKTLYISMGSSIFWTTYGVLRGFPLIVLTSVISLIIAIVILVIERKINALV
jgi:uncharacterized protein with PQ loop repeat